MSDQVFTLPDLGEVRLFLEEICGELCRMDHVARTDVQAEAIVVRREVSLGQPGACGREA